MTSDDNAKLVERWNREVPVGSTLYLRRLGIYSASAETTGPAYIDSAGAPMVPVTGSPHFPTAAPLGFVIGHGPTWDAACDMVRRGGWER